MIYGNNLLISGKNHWQGCIFILMVHIGLIFGFYTVPIVLFFEVFSLPIVWLLNFFGINIYPCCIASSGLSHGLCPPPCLRTNMLTQSSHIALEIGGNRQGYIPKQA